MGHRLRLDRRNRRMDASPGIPNGVDRSAGPGHVDAPDARGGRVADAFGAHGHTHRRHGQLARGACVRAWVGGRERAGSRDVRACVGGLVHVGASGLTVRCGWARARNEGDE